MNKNTYMFEEIIKNIEKFKLGTKIKSEVGDIYNLSRAEGEGKRRKFSRWNGTRLRFMTYENIGREFEIIEDEELKMFEQEWFDEKEGTMRIVEVDLAVKINEIINKVNSIEKELNKWNYLL